MSKEDRPKHDFYDVEKFRRVRDETARTLKGVRKLIGRLTRFLDSIQGMFVPGAVFVIIFGTLTGVVIGAAYGPLAFLGLFGSVIGGLAFILHKRSGSSLQFGDYSIWRRLLGTVIAFLILGIIFLLVVTRFNILNFFR